MEAGISRELQEFRTTVKTYMAIQPEASQYDIAKALHVTRSKVQRAIAANKRSPNGVSKSVSPQEEPLQYSEKGDSAELSSKSRRIKTLDHLLESGNVDLETWDVDRFIVNKWEVGARGEDGLQVEPLFQVKAWLKRKTPIVIAIESLLADMKRNSVRVPKLKHKRKSHKRNLAMELSIYDVHYGLRCYRPAASGEWNMDIAGQIYLETVEHLIAQVEHHGVLDEILFPIGNDFLHADNREHTTTKGTLQPGCEQWDIMVRRGYMLLIGVVERLKELAPVRVISVAGNHANHTEQLMGDILWAYFHNDKNVTVDISSQPTKFWQWGTVLLGFEHGHELRNNLRLAGLMSTLVPREWADTTYREWHLGDQHRKASGKPSMFEEQGVSVEYLPGLTPPNVWSTRRGYIGQKRGGLAYIWDKKSGAVARYHACINNETGEVMT